MKKNRIYAGSALLCALALTASCSNEETMENTVRTGFTVKAEMGVAQTRTTVATEATEGKYQVNWSASDQIYVYGTNVEGTLALENGEGTTSATFKGSLQGESGPEALQYALYPKPTVDDKGGMTITLPSSYTYATDESNSPMYGVFGENKAQVDFRHLCGMIRLKIGGIPSDDNDKTLTLTSQDGAITGTAAVTETDGALSLEVPAGEGKAVSFIIPAATSTTSALVFDIPLPVGTYSNGLELKLTSGGEEIVAAKTLKNVVIEAGKMLVMRTLHIHSVTGNTPSFEETQPVATTEELQNALADEAVKVIELTEDITLSTALSVTSTEGKTIDLGDKKITAGSSAFNIGEDAKLELKNGEISASYMLSWIQKNSTLILDHIKTPANDVTMQHGIYANAGKDTSDEGGGSGATITVKNSEIYTKFFTIATNANQADATYPALNITVENSTLCGETGLMVNVPSNVTVENSTLIGGLQGLLVRGGTVTCMNTTIKKDSRYTTDSGTYETWKDGNQVAPAAITLGNKNSNAYQYATSLTLEGCTVSVENSNTDKSPVVYAHANSDADKGVTFNYDKATTFSPAIDTEGRSVYDSENITVNGTRQSGASN